MAITITATPAKQLLGRGFWADGFEMVTKLLNVLQDCSNVVPGTNTITDFQNAIKTIRDEQ